MVVGHHSMRNCVKGSQHQHGGEPLLWTVENEACSVAYARSENTDNSPFTIYLLTSSTEYFSPALHTSNPDRRTQPYILICLWHAGQVHISHLTHDSPMYFYTITPRGVGTTCVWKVFTDKVRETPVVLIRCGTRTLDLYRGAWHTRQLNDRHVLTLCLGSEQAAEVGWTGEQKQVIAKAQSWTVTRECMRLCLCMGVTSGQ